MPPDSGDSRWFADRPALLAIASVSIALAALIVLPYLNAVLLAVILAYVLYPAQRRLRRYVGATISALVLVVVAMLAVIVPASYLIAVALREAFAIAATIQADEVSPEELERRLEEIGLTVELTELYDVYREPITTGLQGLATGAIEVVGGIPELLIGLTITLFVLFSLLRDGDRLVAWVRRVVPIRPEVQAELLDELDRLMWASVVGNVAVAAIQAVLLGVGLYVLGLPAVAFLTVATFVLALLPLVGAFGVWLPVSIYLAVVGRPIAAVALVAYGTLVSGSDMYLRPALIGRSAAFDPSVIVLGIFGGLVVFGAVGLFIGPVVLGGAKVTVDTVSREYRRTMST